MRALYAEQEQDEESRQPPHDVCAGIPLDGAF